MISTSPLPALATETVPTPSMRWKKDWSTCKSRTSECRTSRVCFDRMPFRSMERLLVTLNVVVRDWRHQITKINPNIKGKAQSCGVCGFSWAAKLPSKSSKTQNVNFIGRVRKMAGRNFSKSCSFAGGVGDVTAAVVAGCGACGTAWATWTGICIGVPQPGHLAVLPACLSDALTVLPQLGHLTRIDISPPFQKRLDSLIIICKLTKIKVACSGECDLPGTLPTPTCMEATWQLHAIYGYFQRFLRFGFSTTSADWRLLFGFPAILCGIATHGGKRPRGGRMS